MDDLARLEAARDYAYRLSPYYRRDVYREPLRSWQDFHRLPLTGAEDLQSRSYLDFIALPQQDIERIVTLPSSGSSGTAKRIAFAAADIERTIDYFAIGMSGLVGSGQRVLICMPGRSRFGISDLLGRGLERIGVLPYYLGPIDDLPLALKTLKEVRPQALVGLPQQMLWLCEEAVAADSLPAELESMLLSADVMPESLRQRLQRLTSGRIRNHYGATELCYGGALECEAMNGLHVRDEDFYVEIVDSDTGLPLPDGERGELVVTTLRERAMPLIRYRSGDLASLHRERCRCGQRSPRLDRPVRKAWAETRLPGTGLAGSAWDELLFALEGVLDYTFSIAGSTAGSTAEAPEAAEGRNIEVSEAKETIGTVWIGSAYDKEKTRAALVEHPDLKAMSLRWRIESISERDASVYKRGI